ncbi:hypothetical protein RJ640_002331 [Escallonia rubra]|uniref:Basic blue protein n=1 Tax=Escallonia rubra TaxID=112253 RepID=A0AA88QC70_9ASTE|nr:hypothetical protein RJ640_002331 [Escallonia rubra]
MSAEKGVAVVVTAMLLFVLLHSNVAQADTYNVGDSSGWGFNVTGWADNKSFKAGDTLVFKYKTEFHNVVAVNKACYDSCEPTGKVYESGNDEIELEKGDSYFICGKPGHCAAGMKIAVAAA